MISSLATRLHTSCDSIVIWGISLEQDVWLLGLFSQGQYFPLSSASTAQISRKLFTLYWRKLWPNNPTNLQDYSGQFLMLTNKSTTHCGPEQLSIESWCQSVVVMYVEKQCLAREETLPQSPACRMDTREMPTTKAIDTSAPWSVPGDILLWPGTRLDQWLVFDQSTSMSILMSQMSNRCDHRMEWAYICKEEFKGVKWQKVEYTLHYFFNGTSSLYLIR